MQRKVKFSLKLIKGILLTILISGSCAQAAPLKKKSATKPSPPKLEEITDSEDEEKKSLEQKFIESNKAISEWFDGVAEGVDLFLVGRRLTHRKNESNIKIENTSYFVDGSGPLNITSVGGSVRLPNLEDYFQLKFTSYDEKSEQRTNRNNFRQAPRQKNYGATIGVFRKLGNVRTTFEPRIEFQNPLKVSHSLTFESVADMKTFEVNPKLEFYAQSDKGVGAFQALNFHFQLDKIFSITWTNEGDYEEKLHKLTMNNGLALGQQVTDRAALSYGFVLTSDNRPSYHLEGYSLYTSWNHLLYKNMLDYEITPHWDFAGENNFRGVVGLLVNVSLNF